MGKFAFSGLVAGLVFASWSSAMAEQARYLCLPMPGNANQGYSVQCEVKNNELVSSSCGCDAQYLLVDPNGPSQITTPRPISNQ
jgi:hypothetical protein